jgi:GntR family transcriptional regulator / MocR family aminotransferase
MTKSLDQSAGAKRAVAPNTAARAVAQRRGTGFAWVIDIESGGEPDQPMFLRIARAISAEIRRGRLEPHARLPGSRELARSLHVHRNTVLAAYRELIAEGWIEPQQGQGTFVSAQLPELKARSFGKRKVSTKPAASIAYDMPPSPVGPVLGRDPPKGTLRMLGGLPDLRLVPVGALTRALRRVVRRDPDLLGYAHPAGHPRLRAALAGMLRASRGLRVEPDGMCVTRGSQMGIALTAEALLRPGDVVAIEAVGYRPAWQALLRVGAQLEPLAVDAHGLRVPQLEALCQHKRVRAVYLTPHHQYPTTVPLAPGRRLQLLELARRFRFVVIEDDYDHEFHYEGRPLLPLASADDAGSVVYVGTLSKVFAPGVRIGYVVAPPGVLQELQRRRYYLDRQGDHLTEAALAELIEDGELQRHTRRMRRSYHARRDRCAELLRKHLGAALTFEVPNGGMALWANAAPDIDVEAWAQRAETNGVVFQTEKLFRWDGHAGSHLRLGYAALTELELARAVRRLADSLPTRSARYVHTP